MSLAVLAIVVVVILSYYKIRDFQGKQAQHKRAIAKSCLCGECNAKKEANRHH